MRPMPAMRNGAVSNRQGPPVGPSDLRLPEMHAQLEAATTCRSRLEFTHLLCLTAKALRRNQPYR
jgi:hypothetical protein